MRQNPFPPLVRRRSLSATSAGRRGSSIRPKRRSALCWKDCAARRTSRSCAAGKALPPRCGRAKAAATKQIGTAGHAIDLPGQFNGWGITEDHEGFEASSDIVVSRGALMRAISV